MAQHLELKMRKVHDNVSAFLYPPTRRSSRAINPTVVGTTITLEPTAHAYKSGAEKQNGRLNCSGPIMTAPYSSLAEVLKKLRSLYDRVGYKPKSWKFRWEICCCGEVASDCVVRKVSRAT